MAQPACRVWKLGGSLLGLPDLTARIERVLREQPTDPAYHELLIVGGGKMIDAIRDLDEVHHFNADVVHWRCVELLSVSAALLAQLLPEWELIVDVSRLESMLRNRTASRAIVDVSNFYGPANNQLPENWDTTTDSIAALLAARFNAELVLLKSCDPPSEDWSVAARQGYVDLHFPAMAEELKQVRTINLRAPALDQD